MTYEEIDERYREAALDDNATGWDDPTAAEARDEDADLEDVEEVA